MEELILTPGLVTVLENNGHIICIKSLTFRLQEKCLRAHGLMAAALHSDRNCYKSTDNLEKGSQSSPFWYVSKVLGRHTTLTCHLRHEDMFYEADFTSGETAFSPNGQSAKWSLRTVTVTM